MLYNTLNPYEVGMSHMNPDACITCSTCVAQCPIAAATTEFLGPRMVGPAHERFRLMGMPEEKSLHYCSNCKNCDIACPHGVPISTFNMMARAAYAKEHGLSLRDWMLAHGADIAKYIGFIPAFLRNFGMKNPISREVLHTFGVHKKAPLPSFAHKTFRTQFRKLAQKIDAKNMQGTVVFFPGCYVDIYSPQTGIDIIYVLNKAGYKVIVPDELSCCGLPMVANGFWEDAEKGAIKNAQVLLQWQKQGHTILTGCPSCSLMFNGDIPHYFPKVEKTYGKIAMRDAQEFILHCIEKENLPLQSKVHDISIMYHAPCHLRAQGAGLLGYEILQKVYGNAVKNANAGCCGISGSYGFKKEKYNISMQVGQQLFDTVKHSQVDLCSSECGTCRIQIEHGTQKQCLHPISLLRQALI